MLNLYVSLASRRDQKIGNNGAQLMPWQLQNGCKKVQFYVGGECFFLRHRKDTALNCFALWVGRVKKVQSLCKQKYDKSPFEHWPSHGWLQSLQLYCTVLYLKLLGIKMDNGTAIKRGLNKVVFCLVRPVCILFKYLWQRYYNIFIIQYCEYGYSG